MSVADEDVALRTPVMSDPMPPCGECLASIQNEKNGCHAFGSEIRTFDGLLPGFVESFAKYLRASDKNLYYNPWRRLFGGKI